MTAKCFRYLLLTVMLISGIRGDAQDIHFSQYAAAPSLINPGATGIFDGKARFTLDYRNQWTMLNSNYQTTAAAFETAILKKKAGGNFLGVGVNVLSDKAGIGALKKLSFNLAGAFHLQINDEQNIGLGIQGGYAQRSIDPTALTWGSQYNGVEYDGDLPGETINENISAIDIAAGFHWMYTISNAADLNLGVGAYHLSQPQNGLVLNTEAVNDVMRFIAHGSGRFTSRGSDLAYYPNFMVAFQGPAKEITAGMSMRYMLKESSKYTGFVKGNA